MSKLMLFFIGCALLCFIPTHTTHAATIDVCTLGELTTAITSANSNGEADVINFNCSATLTFTTALTIADDGAGNGITINTNGNAVIFDGGNSTNFFVVNIGASLTLNGFTLQNGNAVQGGAIESNGTLTISNSTFTNNSASGFGGAIFNHGGSLTTSASTFTGNSGMGGGGAIFNATGTVTINSSIFTNNFGFAGHATFNGGIMFSQDSHYENNNCLGSFAIIDNGGNTRHTAITSSGCPGVTPTNLNLGPLMCSGNNLLVLINGGDENFDIRGDGMNLPIENVPTGSYIALGAGTWANITVTERRGERQTLPLGGITCPSGVITPPSLPPAPAVTVLGCALDTTDGLDIFNAPDNTYCRILMKNGAVIGYSGAIPADLISLGVIFAVDVYRLEGGASVNTFPNYARVCLAGQGRLFYMDSRNAPRVSIELQSENVDNLTCGWIPAPGTLILTN